MKNSKKSCLSVNCSLKSKGRDSNRKKWEHHVSIYFRIDYLILKKILKDLIPLLIFVLSMFYMVAVGSIHPVYALSLC